MLNIIIFYLAIIIIVFICARVKTSSISAVLFLLMIFGVFVWGGMHNVFTRHEYTGLKIILEIMSLIIIVPILKNYDKEQKNDSDAGNKASGDKENGE